jgi:regulator of protease activity HflC (stomatin/prohibitin superfamily)
MLRAGASWLMGLVLGAAAVAGTLAPLHYYPEIVGPERLLAYVLRVLILVLAVETLFNFVLDFYRPRQAGEEPRPAFDSRLLGLFSEPGGIARSIAEAVNYQFGFEVSSTWLYKLLERAALPLMGFAVLMLFAASSFVIVNADQEALVERFGRPLEQLLGPGLHVKYPWPIDIAYKVSTQQIHEFRLGDSSEPDKENKTEPLILWTNKHEQEPHLNVLIATPRLAEFMMSDAASRPAMEATGPQLKSRSTFAETGSAVSVSILRVAMTIQYEICNAKDWISRYREPETMLKAIASHELTLHSASQTVEGMLGEQRGELEKLLRKRIEVEAKRADLGIRIRFLGLQGVHPPEETAEAFEDVIGAEQKRTASVSSAWEDYYRRLSQVAGNVDQAQALNSAIQRINQLESDPKALEKDRLEARSMVRSLFFGDSKEKVRPIGGEAAGIIVKARAKRWSLENQAHAQAKLFEQARALKDVAPKVFYLRETLKTLAIGMQGIRKYVLAAHGDMKVGTIHLNLQDPASAQLDFSDTQK